MGCGAVASSSTAVRRKTGQAPALLLRSASLQPAGTPTRFTANARMQRYVAAVVAVAVLALAATVERAAAFLPTPLAQLHRDARTLAARLPAPSAFEVFDL